MEAEDPNGGTVDELVMVARVSVLLRGVGNAFRLECGELREVLE
jgi:hypothetical protein